jgi:hypothetical protein
VSREQRTRLNIMISEQTGAAAQPQAPGRSSRAEDEQAETDAEGAQADVQPETRPRSIFDLPFAQDADAERDVEPDGDDDATGSRRG